MEFESLRQEIELSAQLLGSLLVEKRRVAAAAESCTGGLLSAAMTSIPGSSAWFDRGFVTYDVRAKTEMLDVAPELIQREGVVSEAVAKAMARGAVARSAADIAVGITGVAGPGGGTPQTPVGTVAIGWSERDYDGAVITTARTILVPGSRTFVRLVAVRTAIQGMMALLEYEDPALMPCEY